MPWKTATLGALLGPVTKLLNSLTQGYTELIATIALIKKVLNLFLSKVMSELNALEAILNALSHAGAYSIVLSGSKGSWNGRMSSAPNAPPTGNELWTCGICVVVTAANPEGLIAAFKKAMLSLQEGIKFPKLEKPKSLPPGPPIVNTIPTVATDIWQSLTLAQLFPATFSIASDLLLNAGRWLSNLQHAISMINILSSSIGTLLDEANSFMNDLNGSGVYAVLLNSKKQGIMPRLVSELNAPPNSSQLYTAGFCVCFYAPDLPTSDKNYESLTSVFDPNAESSILDPIYKPIKSWATPPSGYYDREVYITLNCNIHSSKIYYTVNGTDPREGTSVVKIFDPLVPIHITKNNSVVRFYAADGQNIERITREAVYHLVEATLDVPYSNKYGVTAGVGVDDITQQLQTPQTLQEILSGASVPATPYQPPFTTPLNPAWGDQENCIDPGPAVAAGNKELAQNMMYTAPDIDQVPLPPPTLIPPDPPVLVSDVVMPADTDYGISNSANKNTVVYDASIEAELVPAIETGLFGCAPWNTVSNFPDTTAYWIWNTSASNTSAPTNQPVLFKSVFENTIQDKLAVTIKYMADNTAMFYHNGIYKDTDTGWYLVPNSSPPKYLGSWEIADGYKSVVVNLPLGKNEFMFVATNWSGYAGLIFSISINDGSNRILVNSDNTTMANKNDWYTNYITATQEKAMATASTLGTTATNPIILKSSAYYGQNSIIPVTIALSEILSENTYGLSLSEDGLTLKGLVSFIAPISLSVKTLASGRLARLDITPILLSTDTVADDISPKSNSKNVYVPINTKVLILLSATDPNGEPLTYTITGYPTHGTLTDINLPHLSYVPDNNYIGKDKFTFIAINSRSKSSVATIDLNVSQ